MMKRSLATAALFGAILSAPGVHAQPAQCADAPNQAAGTECAANLFKKADKELNVTYSALLGALPDKGKDYARAAQRAWVDFRDKECVSQTGGGPNQGGTIWPMIYMECQTALTRQRVEELKAQVKCPGGDLSCSP